MRSLSERLRGVTSGQKNRFAGLCGGRPFGSGPVVEVVGGCFIAPNLLESQGFLVKMALGGLAGRGFGRRRSGRLDVEVIRFDSIERGAQVSREGGGAW